MASVTIRGLGGSREVVLENDGPITAEVLREAANIADGVVLRQNGENLRDDAIIEDGATIVSAPAQAKHGA